MIYCPTKKKNKPTQKMSVILHLAGRIVTPLTCQHPGPFSKSRFSLNIDKQYTTDL